CWSLARYHRGALVRPHVRACPALGWLSAFSHRGFLLMLQENPERETVRDEQQRHDQRRNDECRTQLPRRKAGRIGLVEGVNEIDGAPDVENPRDAQKMRVAVTCASPFALIQ